MASLTTERHRAEQLALRALTLRELHRLWPTLDVTRLAATYPGWAAAVARLIRDHHAISAALAARYLRTLRTEQGVPGRAEVIRPPAPPAEQVATSLRVTTLVAAAAAAKAGVTAQLAADKTFVTSSGAVTRLVLGGGRDTIRLSATADPHARGWRRVTSGRGCEFCRMLAGRGAVYQADTAVFHSHDHCSCTAEPVWN